MSKSKGGQISQFVYGRIKHLMHTTNQSMIAADLARLRRGIGKEPGSQPDIWELIIDELPESLQGTGERPSNGEYAVHTALTCFALHQQGKDIKTNCMSESGISLGTAMRQLIQRNPDREAAIKRRFTAALTADSYEELAWHLRGLIQLLRAEDVKLDYPLLAKDLYHFQFSELRDRIRLQWGRHFYYRPSATRHNNKSNYEEE
jgi:CRISPR system Cascade subunit CasB